MIFKKRRKERAHRSDYLDYDEFLDKPTESDEQTDREALESRLSALRINPTMPGSAPYISEHIEHPEDNDPPAPLDLIHIAWQGFEGLEGVATGLAAMTGVYFAVKNWFAPNLPQIYDFCHSNLYNLYDSMSSIING